LVFSIQAFGQIDFEQITETDRVVFHKLNKVIYSAFKKEQSDIKLKQIRFKYLVLKKYQAVPTTEELKVESRRIQRNTKQKKKIKSIKVLLQTEAKYLKFFVFPAFVDRAVDAIYKIDTVSQTKSSLDTKAKLEAVIMGKKRFAVMARKLNLVLTKVIYKVQNESLEIPLGVKDNNPYLEVLKGSSIKAWREEIIQKFSMGLGYVFWGREKDYEWELIRVSRVGPKAGHYEFDVIKISKRTKEEWLKSVL
jgi:hypothetical protein